MRWLLIAVLALAGCKKAPEPPPPALPPALEAPPVADRHAPFWKWVVLNLEDLKAVKTGQEVVTEQLSFELELVQPGLMFELGIGKDPFELVISAGGRRDLFPVVTKLVAAAPPMPGTKVIAFRPRKAIEGFSTEVGTEKLAGGDLWFVSGEDPGRKGMLGVDVFVKGMRSERDEGFKDAAFMMLEAAVGEYDLETKIGAIEFKPAPAKPELPLRPLKELPAVVDAWK